MRKGRTLSLVPHKCIHTDPDELLPDGTPDPDYTFSHQCLGVGPAHRQDHEHYPDTNPYSNNNDI